MEHSKTFGFSSAHRWVPCNGSVKLLQDEPPIEDTESSKEGTAAHYVADSMLNAYKHGGNHLDLIDMLLYKKAPNSVIITDEMIDSALTYVNVVIGIVGDDSERKKMLFIENRVDSKYIDPEAWGSADAIFYDVTTNTLYIWDFKHGHTRVDAIGNMQIIGYAQATAETFNYKSINPRLSLNIVQPRCYDSKGPVDNWIISFDHIRAYVNQMKHSVAQYRMNMSKLVTGTWCTNCPVSYKCPALTRVVAECIDHSMKTIPLVMSAEAIAYEKSLIDIATERMKERKTAIDTQIENRVRKGELIPGYKMQEKMSHSKWKTDDVAEIKVMGELLGVNVVQEAKPLTPTQVKNECLGSSLGIPAWMPSAICRSSGMPRLLPRHSITKVLTLGCR